MVTPVEVSVSKLTKGRRVIGYRAHAGNLSADGSTSAKARAALLELALHVATYEATVVTLGNGSRIEIDAIGESFIARLFDSRGGRGPSCVADEKGAWEYGAFLAIQDDQFGGVVHVSPVTAKYRFDRVCVEQRDYYAELRRNAEANLAREAQLAACA